MRKRNKEGHIIKTHYHEVLGMFVAGLIVVTVPAYGAPKDKAPLNSGESADAKTKSTATPRPSATPKKVETSKAKQADSTKAQQIDLRPAMKQIDWKDGRNTVYSGAGVKLMADVKGGQVTGWSATDDKGKPLPTKSKRVAAANATVMCEVCIIVTFPQGGSSEQCFAISCSKLPAPTTPKK